MKFIFTSLIVATISVVPIAALAQAKMSPEQLLAYATDRQACGSDLAVLTAEYDATKSNVIRVTCGDPTGVIPLIGGLGLGAGGAAAAAGVFIAAAAAGGGGTTPDTQ